MLLFGGVSSPSGAKYARTVSLRPLLSQVLVGNHVCVVRPHTEGDEPRRTADSKDMCVVYCVVHCVVHCVAHELHSQSLHVNPTDVIK